MTKHPELFSKLCAPIPAQYVKTKPGPRGTQASYVDSRTLMWRLDEVLGPENWTSEYVHHEKFVECRLTVTLPNGQKLVRNDTGGGAGLTDEGDDEKSAVTDSFKRACMALGVAREVYGAPRVNWGRPTGSTESESGAEAEAVLADSIPRETSPIVSAGSLPPVNGRAFYKAIINDKVLTAKAKAFGRHNECPPKFMEWDQALIQEFWNTLADEGWQNYYRDNP